MKINSLSFYSGKTKWKLSKVEFKKMTLLVGASGVGKTRILRAILELRDIVNGKSINGIKWEIDFTTLNKEHYIWQGEFEQVDSLWSIFKPSEDSGERNHPKVLFEKLWLNGQQIVDRNAEKIMLDGQKTVKLAQDKSALNLLKEEDLVSPAFHTFQKIIFSDQVASKKVPQRFDPVLLTKEKMLKKYKTIEAIRASDEKLITKLYLACNNAPDVMKAIKGRFMDIFPFVIDLKIAPLKFSADDDVSPILKEIPFIQIKENNVEDWIIQPQMSSGMHRTLMQLSELYLCPAGTLILIDEFENSLGVNCMDELTTDLQTFPHRNLQFIITSHHPYIINQIDFKNWKLVTRTGSQVVVREASDIIDFKKSRQRAFMQLMQLEEFTDGVKTS